MHRRSWQTSHRPAACLGLIPLLAGFALLSPALLRACELPVCTFPSGPDYPRIASDGAGGAFIVWRDFRNDSDGDLYIQRVAAGFTIAPGWPIDGIPVTSAPGAQGVADLAPDGMGGVIVVWLDFRNFFTTRRDIFAQRFLVNGTIAPGWPEDGLPVCVQAADQVDSRIASDGTGGVIIAWQDYRAGGAFGDGDITKGDIYALRVRPDGTPGPGWAVNGNPVCTEPGNQDSPRLVPDGVGAAVVAWRDRRNLDPDGGDLYTQRLTSEGQIAPGWPTGGLPICVANGEQGGIMELVTDGAGGAIAAWVDSRTEPFEGDIFAQRVTADGAIATGWPAEGVPVAVAPSYQLYPDMIADGVGGAYLVWEDYRDYENTNADLFGQRITGSGAVATGWPANGLRVATGPGWQLHPALVLDGQGGMLFAYQSYGGAEYDLYAQRVAADGTFPASWSAAGRPLCVDFGADDQRPDAVSDGAGGMLVAAEHVVPGASNIYALRLRADGPTAALVALESAEAEPGRVSLTWYGAEAAGSQGTVERRTTVSEWERLGEAVADGTGQLRYEDRAVAAGTRYAYRLTYRGGGQDLATAETWVDVPAPRFALHGAQPNPVVGEFVVGFSLPSAEAARLEVYDVAGRQVLVRDVGSLGIGRHQVSLARSGRLAAGVFTVVLAQGERRAMSRVVVIR